MTTEATSPDSSTVMKERKEIPLMPEDTTNGPEGCYLVYESDSGGKLMLVYSQGDIPNNAVGFWCPMPPKKIQGFKFKQAGGRSELIKGIAGGDANRRRYFVGWCQFVKLAKQFNGKLIKFPNSIQGVEVDVYGYRQATQEPFPLHIDEGFVNVSELDAVAVIPKHNPKFQGIKSLQLSTFLELGNLTGASTTM